MIELSDDLSVHHELLRWRRKLLDVVDRAIVITLLVSIWSSVLVTLLGGR